MTSLVLTGIFSQKAYWILYLSDMRVLIPSLSYMNDKLDKRKSIL